MSASLVGSEMCIRDRCNPQSAQGLPVLQSASLRSPPCGACNVASGIRASVSYTHLTLPTICSV
eukprot:10781236-Alexandrium_andersonii.AAC.1